MSSFRHVILPDSGTELLREELALAFSGLGLKVSRVKPGLLHQEEFPKLELEELLDDGPCLLFSINFEGLSTLKPLMERVALHRGAIAAWFVDNPWNILSGVRDPRWKQLPLFVTDASFIPTLRREGAGQVFHLPLAASPDHFSQACARDDRPWALPDLAPFVFVGRSVFPGKKKFFEGTILPQGLLQEAEALLNRGVRTDLLWWEKRLYGGSLQEQPEGAPGGSSAPAEKLNAEESAQARIWAYREKRGNPTLADTEKNAGSTPEKVPFDNIGRPVPDGATSAGPAHFWPGKEARRPALGAEESALCWRTLCLREAVKAGAALLATSVAAHEKNMAAASPGVASAKKHSSHAGGLQPKATPGTSIPGLDVFGDEGWQGLMPEGARLHLPVDYYTRLPAIYASARFSLCLTSLQLPCGLSQRHFDVWTAGGLGLTDATPGLDIFPEELVRPVRFSTPADILATARRAEDYPGGRAKLIADWQDCLRKKHCYRHRAEEILKHL